MNELTEIKRGTIRPGDYLVLRYSGILTPRQRTDIKECFRSLPGLLNAKILVLENGMDIEFCTKEQTP